MNIYTYICVGTYGTAIQTHISFYEYIFANVYKQMLITFTQTIIFVCATIKCTWPANNISHSVPRHQSSKCGYLKNIFSMTVESINVDF